MIITRRRFEQETNRKAWEIAHAGETNKKIRQQEAEIRKLRRKLWRTEKELKIHREELQAIKELMADMQLPKAEEERAARIRGYYMGDGGSVYCTDKAVEVMAAGEDRTGQSVS